METPSTCDDISMNQPVWPPLTVIDTIFTDVDVAMAIMCSGLRLTLSIDQDDMCEGSRNDALHTQFEDFVDNHDEKMEDFEEWAITPCLPFLRQLQAVGPSLSSKRLLSGYLHPPTFALSLKNHNGKLTPVPCERDLTYEDTIFNAFTMSEIDLGDLSATGIPSYKSSELIIAGYGSSENEEFCAMPRSVRRAPDAEEVAFKYASDVDSFRRELNVLLRMRQRVDRDHIHIPKLVGLVEHPEHGQMIEGLLSTYVQGARTLGDAAHENPSSDTRQRWARQIREAVDALHDEGLVWGDVKPDNVLVDSGLDAWVVDFGGGWTPDWVDPDVAGTVEGDLKAVAKLEGWLATAP